MAHPDDVKMILDTEGEFICYGDISSENTVFVKTDSEGRVLSFSRKEGDYEWTGPACMARKNIH